ncbi:hypothetical protein F8M41_009753 [Gigaspora margarita]|uniref:Uncharacterized protein n=1 Tax=Gigaspora margarita TaxID=4874 RepID=A0A8H4AUR0_GIGMA|nr:hypothetical protein F8M41_009753 [Gigaspora margarita]
MPLPLLLENHIIKSTERFSKSNIKVYCKACVEVLGENEGKKNCFPNKTDRIIQHLKKCVHFTNKMTPEEKEEIFALSNNKEISSEKRAAPLTISYPIPQSLLRHERSSYVLPLMGLLTITQFNNCHNKITKSLRFFY